jgi:hypothetical protein
LAKTDFTQTPSIRNVPLLKRQIGKTAEKIFLFANKDGRVAVPISLYDEVKYAQALDKFAQEFLLIIPDFNEFRLRKLRLAAIDYVAEVSALFGHRKKILTEMRVGFGTAFVDAYKYSNELIRLIDAEELDSEFSPDNIPEQSPSAIYAKVEDKKIVLDEGAGLHPLLRPGALEQTRAYLMQEVEVISIELEKSNVDRRFVNTFKILRGRLSFQDDAGAISLGLHVRAILQILKSVQDEISDILTAQLAANLTHISYFASQYQDWVDFVRNAQTYPGRELVEGEIEKAIENLNITLGSNPETVDKRIPESFHLFTKLLDGDVDDRRNAIYATVRGFENICIATIRFVYAEAVQFLKDSTNKARSTLVNVAAATIVVLTLALIADFMPVIKSAPELNWLLENLPRLEKISNLFK